jgi:hypothetical protein
MNKPILEIVLEEKVARNCFSRRHDIELSHKATDEN